MTILGRRLDVGLSAILLLMVSCSDSNTSDPAGTESDSSTDAVVSDSVADQTDDAQSEDSIDDSGVTDVMDDPETDQTADTQDVSEGDAEEDESVSDLEDSGEDQSQDIALDDGAASETVEDTSDDAEDDSADPVDTVDAGSPEPPSIHNLSPASAEHAADLVERALDGLGFAEEADGAPSPDDRVFVGRYYIAWIDQTGFYGKVNGLWRLNGSDGDDLDFSLMEPDGRPVNFLIPGENGLGEWPGGYPGAEHIEFPNRTPEANDSPDCADGDWCNQYGHNEAADFDDPDIPWWSACNSGAPAWTDVFEPISVDETEEGLTIMYEGPLVKVADGDGNYDGDDCNQDYLFADGERRRVFLRVGYQLYANDDHIDRLMQIRNPAENPAFDGPMSLIGGFVVTTWPSPHRFKRLDDYLRPELRDINDPRDGTLFTAGEWTSHHHRISVLGSDEVFAWLDQPVSLSVSDQFLAGRSATLSHVGESDNEDVGFCFCRVHGGLELGGGLIHSGVSLPIDPGASSVLARRRLQLPGAESGITGRIYEAESDLSHRRGRRSGVGWWVNVREHSEGYMAYGPYATDWGEGSGRADFVLMIDNHVIDNDVVLTLDVYDADDDRVLARRTVRRQAFDNASEYQTFSLDFNLSGRAEHQMETRVYWYDNSSVWLDKVLVSLDQ